MKVRCIKTSLDLKVIKDEYYIVKYKKMFQNYLTLVGVKGYFDRTLFEMENGSEIIFQLHYENPRYYPPLDFVFGSDCYVKLISKNTNNGFLEPCKFYKIESVNYNSAIMGHVIRVNNIDYMNTIFHYYTKEEKYIIERKEKIDQLKNRIHESKVHQ